MTIDLFRMAYCEYLTEVCVVCCVSGRVHTVEETVESMSLRKSVVCWLFHATL